MANIQDLFVGEPEYIDIPPDEYEGPLVIRHSCTVNGNGATLWAKAENYPGYPLAIEAPNVTIKNLRVELTGKPPVDKFGHNIAFTAIHISNEETLLENVEVYGQIAEPFYDEDILGNTTITTFDFNYSLPRTIDLGTFAAGKQNAFTVKLDGVHENYRVINSIQGLDIEPQTLSKEKNELQLTVAPMCDGIVIFGDLILEMNRPLGLSTMPSKILRRICVSGRAQNGAETKTSLNLQTENPQPPEYQETTDTEEILTSTSNQVAAGQKLSAPNSENIRVAFRAAELNMTIDACAFCLAENKKVHRDTDFVFFNNPVHESLSVALTSKERMPGVALNLKKIPDAVQAVVVYFSIYDEGNRVENNFSRLSSPAVVVLADENILYEFPVALDSQKIFKALEFYRDKGDWTIFFIGLTSDKNLADLCKIYGVEVL